MNEEQLSAFRHLLAAAEEAGWDLTGNADVLNAARVALGQIEMEYATVINARGERVRVSIPED